LQDITVDTSAGLVTAGAGVSLYDVYQELANIGYAFPAGSCPTVGISMNPRLAAPQKILDAGAMHRSTQSAILTGE
jgi:hypothetical protein